MRNHQWFYSSLVVMSLGTGASFSSDMVHEVDKLGNVLSSMQLRSAISLGSPIYSDEMVKLVEKRKAIIEPYAPTNLWRKSFNRFKKSETAEVNGKTYCIAGMRKASVEEKKSIRQKTIESLPHDGAFISNTRGFLYVKASLADNDGYVQIHYGYVPGLLDHSGTSEYTFSVETELSLYDKGLYHQLTKQINELNHYMAFDQQDRDEETLKVAQVWDKSRQPQTPVDSIKLQAQAFIEERLEEYTNLRIDRLVSLSNYSLFKETQHKTMLRHFSNQVLQYRQYLIETTFQLQALEQGERLDEAFKAFQSNCSRFSHPLIKFPKWFITKDTSAPEYAFYQSWN